MYALMNISVEMVDAHMRMVLLLIVPPDIYKFPSPRPVVAMT
jgi:hypothetical protein